VRQPSRRKWITEEISRLDPVADSALIMLLSTNRLLPRYGAAMVLNLLYCLGFMRISGQLEGARAVDRQGAGKIHRQATASGRTSASPGPCRSGSGASIHSSFPGECIVSCFMRCAKEDSSSAEPTMRLY
jgi:hypothetical protein